MDKKQPQTSSTGFELLTGTSSSFDLPSPWSGRVWGRAGCSNNNGRFYCATADCGSGQIECNGAGADPPATLVEFTIASGGGRDFYDVSNVDGFNVPASVTPQGGSGGCTPSSCPNNINSVCPLELQVRGSDGSVIACKSACVAFNQPHYCCTGEHNTPETCPSTNYSKFFKQQCPDAFSTPFDDSSSTFTCSASPGYVITFCP